MNAPLLGEVSPRPADSEQQLRLDLVGLLGAELLPSIDEYLLHRRAGVARKIINNFPEKATQTHTDQL